MNLLEVCALHHYINSCMEQTTAVTESLEQCPLCQSDRLVTIDRKCCLQRCKTCGFLFLSPRPTAAELLAFYSQPTKSDEWMVNEMGRDDLWMRRLTKLHRIRRGGSLLDIGTGIGQFLHYAQNFFSPVAGTEVSDAAIRIARRKYGFTIHKGEVTEIDWGEQRFDVITLFQVLEHVSDPLQIILKCYELLHEDGVLIISVPNELQSLKSKVRAFARLFGKKKYQNTGKYGIPKFSFNGSSPYLHLSHFTPKVLQVCLQRCGFEIRETALDPYYENTGGKKALHDLHYFFGSLFWRVFHKNVYDAIWITAVKPKREVID
ncbi:MAG: class I SAM-dependent methyltransferase [bacterium]|nr:class I SAM-dependent methyltransferase [bacterium]